MRRSRLPRRSLSTGDIVPGSVLEHLRGGKKSSATFGHSLSTVGFQTPWARIVCPPRRPTCLLHRKQHHPYRSLRKFLSFKIFNKNTSDFFKRFSDLVTKTFRSRIRPIHRLEYRIQYKDRSFFFIVIVGRRLYDPPDVEWSLALMNVMDSTFFGFCDLKT